MDAVKHMCPAELADMGPTPVPVALAVMQHAVRTGELQQVRFRS